LTIKFCHITVSSSQERGGVFGVVGRQVTKKVHVYLIVECTWTCYVKTNPPKFFLKKLGG